MSKIKEENIYLKIVYWLAVVESEMACSGKTLDIHGLKHLRGKIEELLLREKLVTKEETNKAKKTAKENTLYISKENVKEEITNLEHKLMLEMSYSCFKKEKYLFAIENLNILKGRLKLK